MGGVTAAVALGAGGTVASAAASPVARHGLTVVERGEDDPRMWYYRFATDAIGWNPAVNVLLPEDYHTSGRTYPVLYLLHGGGLDQDFISFDREGIRELTRGKPIIVVMPDGGHAGWYSNPVSSLTGPRNWEDFHIHQLLPWIDAHFRTYAEYDGRGVAGFSMGGFGALKYAAKYFGHFASVSSHSGPASLRRDSRAGGALGQPVLGCVGPGRRDRVRRAVGRGTGQRGQPGRTRGELPGQAGFPGGGEQP
ncbi:alpha/beta hydrolase [Actinoalloteichus sp. AHMU CJ021]|uniref:alpha/beta hydrolase n=1 Tax=Actinoalloteichus sp. AHMU CJ021 TaxID=2072503 RepID=UPI00307C5846